MYDLMASDVFSEMWGVALAGKYILVNDVGTTGTRSIIYDEETNVVAESYTELEQIFPKPGWTEQDPVAIFDRCVEVTHKSLDSAGLKASDIAAMGIATQRATSMLWDADTGEPVYNAITWQDARMSDECERVNKSGTFKMLHVVGGGYQRIAPLSKTLKKNPVGKMLIAAAHFTVTPAMSSAHARWTLDNIEGAKEKAAAGKLLFGTVDAWLVWKYTGGRVHATDFSNVSATGMFDPFGMKWSSQLLKPFGLPGGLKFPEIRETGGDFGEALFGEACFEGGNVKCTNGTGTFVDMNTGDEAIASIHKLTPLVAWKMDGKTTYMLEGIISSAGASVQFLRDNLKMIKEAAECEELALCVDDPYARGTVTGLTRGTTREQIVRATLESIAYQCKDVIVAMEMDTGISVSSIKADGGASRNNFLMQFLADILDMKVDRPAMLEATALGAAYFAGIAAGIWKYPDDILRIHRIEREFEPSMTEAKRDELYDGWKRAVERAQL